MDHRALEAELGHRALELVGGGLRIGRGQHGEALEPVGVRADDLVQPVVGAARERHRGLGVEALRGGRAVRQHLHVDAGLVHLLQAQLAEVVQPLAMLGAPRTRPRP